MKRLWKVMPPCISDLMGFEAVLNETEGLGIIDDSSTYKPIRFGRGGLGHSDRGDASRRGEMRDSVPGRGELRDFAHENRGNMEYGFHGRGDHGGHGGRGGGQGLIPGMRVINSDIRNEDIITGTESKVLNAFEKGMAQLSPDFTLLAYGPSASMIGSDLEYAAEKLTGLGNLPVASVKIDGEKDYLYGIGCTLETLGRLLPAPRERMPGTVNILGGNTIDWAKDTIMDVERLLTQNGWQVLSRWGTKETTENLKMASAASVNLVANESGLRLARYMESEFGIPFVVGAPFGSANALAILKELESFRLISPEMEAEAFLTKKNEKDNLLQREESAGAPEILIVGEQFMANAIRQELIRRGGKAIRVLSFYDMDRAYMLPGDKKLVSEDDFAAQANQDSVRVILGDPDVRLLINRKVRNDSCGLSEGSVALADKSVRKETSEGAIRWISLPNGGSLFPIDPVETFNMAGEALDVWLDREKIL